MSNFSISALIENLVKIYTDLFEDMILRELAAEALFRIKPPDPKVQQKIVATLSNEKDLIVEDTLHYFQWISSLPTHLRLPNNLVTIKKNKKEKNP